MQAGGEKKTTKDVMRIWTSFPKRCPSVPKQSATCYLFSRFCLSEGLSEASLPVVDLASSWILAVFFCQLMKITM